MMYKEYTEKYILYHSMRDKGCGKIHFWSLYHSLFLKLLLKLSVNTVFNTVPFSDWLSVSLRLFSLYNKTSNLIFISTSLFSGSEWSIAILNHIGDFKNSRYKLMKERKKEKREKKKFSLNHMKYIQIIIWKHYLL